MPALFLTTFAQTFAAVAKIGLVVVAAGLLVRGRIIRQEHITALSDATVYVFLPCLIFSNITTTFDPAADAYWWLLPLMSLAMASTGFFFGWLVFFRDLPEKANLLPLCALQNAGYLVLPLGQLLVPGQFDRFALFVFLYILVHNPLIWSVGKIFISRTAGKPEPVNWRGLVTPPLLANILALTLVFAGLRGGIPDLVAAPIDLLGQATVPVATFVLGASLGSISLRLGPALGDGLRVALIKLVLLPALMIVILQAIGLGATAPLLAFFLVLEATVAPASSLILAVRTYGGDIQKISGILLINYVLCLATIPFWASVWQILQ